MAWIDDWGVEIGLEELRHPTARAVVAYLASTPDVVTLIGARRNLHGAEILLADLRTDVPQRPAVPVARVEPLGIAFVGDATLPLVMALREDFPDTAHQQLVAEGCPAAICIDDRPWDEALLTWTPAELLQRVAAWFRRAARGELHDPHQPLEPFFGASRYSFVFPRSFLAEGNSVELAAFVNEAEDPTVVHVAPLLALRPPFTGTRILPLAYRVPPELMARMRRAPRHLGSLAAFLEGRDLHLLRDLRARIRRWSGATQEDGHRLGSKLAVIVEMPVVGPGGEKGEATDIRTFVTERSVGQIGVALGVLVEAASDVAASRYARAFPEGSVDETALSETLVEIAQVHVAFDSDRAAELAGRKRADPRRAVLIGAGTIGAHLAEFLVREGRFVWSLVDDDRMLPHNLARHTLPDAAIGRRKVDALRERLTAIFSPLAPPVVAEALPCNVLHPGEHSERLTALLDGADLIVDATASVAASRHLSDLACDARRASAFFNPAGDAVVVLVEPADRSVRLRDLEALYYRAVLREPGLERHLSATGERFAYTGACRAVTNRLPESRAALLSALAAQGLSRVLDADAALLRVWTVGPDGEVQTTSTAVVAVERYPLGEWEVTIDADLKAELVATRARRLPNETGGSLLGIVDAQARAIHVVDALPAPPDSIETSREFERGVAGLEEMVTARMRRVMDQVRYVGEWHSHPPHASITPSPLDLTQLAWTSTVLAVEDCPGLSLIVGDAGVCVMVGEAGSRISPPSRGR
jgi:proteasome lid subunit RPN8/RPN11